MTMSANSLPVQIPLSQNGIAIQLPLHAMRKFLGDEGKTLRDALIAFDILIEEKQP